MAKRTVMFFGEYFHTLDDRGRVSIPKKMRASLHGRQVIVTRGFEMCLFGYRQEDWERDVTREMAQAPFTDPVGRAMRRYLFSIAGEVTLDKIGRILLPSGLKTYAGIKQNIAVIGAGDHFEIWDETSWKSYLDKLKYPASS